MEHMINTSVVAVTGITSKSGQYFLKRIQNEHPIEFIFRFLLRPESTKNNDILQILDDVREDIEVDICNIDLNDVHLLPSLFVTKDGRKADTLLHIAGIKWSVELVRTALSCGVRRFILVHTTGIYSKYKAASKNYLAIESAIEELVNEYRESGEDISISILRPTMIYGCLSDHNISIFIKLIDSLRIFPTVNGGRYDLQPVWCKDLGNAYYDVLTHPSETQNKDYILSGGEPIQLRHMLEIISKYLDVKNVFISCPFFIAYIGAWIIYICSLFKIDLREKVQRLVESRAFPHDDATNDFGYSPSIFEIGVKEEIDMYKKLTRSLRK